MEKKMDTQNGAAILLHEWIGKAIWAIAGFFLIGTYDEVKTNADNVNIILSQNARIEQRLTDYGDRIERLEFKMDGYDQRIKDLYDQREAKKY